MPIKIALAGNPNSGKTTMFNDLTGSSQYVGNWPGVTVEKKEGLLQGNKDVIIQDLPGIYSLSPYSLEEVVTRDYLINEQPDVIINIVDASNIERNLYLTTQLLEVGRPMIIALNMIDIVRKNGDTINVDKLSSMLGVEAVETSALKGEGSKEVVDVAVKHVGEFNKNEKNNIKFHKYSSPVEIALAKIEIIIRDNVKNNTQMRWYSIKVFERDEKIINKLGLSDDQIRKIETSISKCEVELNDDSESILTNERYSWIDKIVAACTNKKDKYKLSTSDKIDMVLTNKWLGLPIFAVMMFLVYYLSISTVGGWATDWVNDVLFGEIILPNTKGFLVSIGTADWMVSLVVEGIIGGVGAVLGFLPQMTVLFFMLAFLEECGYMSRVAFILDKIFHKFGLSGKSFIPMLVSTGCGVPGVMATRTIENESDRRITIMTTTFMPCSAKLPVIALIAGALFPDSIWVAPSAYFIGIGAIIVSSIILKKSKELAGETAPFVMELPKYHMPAAKSVLIQTWDRIKSFVKKAGTIILLACVVIWFLNTFNWRLQMVEPEQSILASIGSFIAPIFSPIGWGNWRPTVATLTGLIAKENVVGTLGVLYGAGQASDSNVIVSAVQAGFTQFSGFSFLVFNLLCAPCVAAVGAIRSEMKSKKWSIFAISYQTIFAYLIAMIIYQLGTFFTGGSFGIWTFIAFAAVGLLIYLLFRPAPNVDSGRVEMNTCTADSKCN